MRTDASLLQEFAGSQSEAAFAELVRRHADLVYATARRQCWGDLHRAQDITQLTFSELIRQAPRLLHHPSLAGWLHTTAMHFAARLRRSEHRRVIRETSAYAMVHELPADAAEVLWRDVRPEIDTALQTLSPPDRDLVLRRFFQGQSYAEIRESLGLTENTARMRVDRALERLRRTLEKRGVRSTTALLTGCLGAHAVSPTPATLLATLTIPALAPISLATSTSTSVLLSLGRCLGRFGEALISAKQWILVGSALTLLGVLTLDADSVVANRSPRVEFAPLQDPNPALPTESPSDSGAAFAWKWAAVESADYRQLATNLRADGAPESLVRDFIGLDLLRIYGARAAQLRATANAAEYWRKPSFPVPGSDEYRRYRELDHEQHAVMQSLFGPHTRPSAAWNLPFMVVDQDAVRFAWLPPEVLPEVLRILAPSLEEQLQENSTPGVRVHQPEVEQRRLDRQLASLKDLLTPAQLEELRWREDPEVEQLRTYTRECALSESEFRQLAAAAPSLELYRPAVSAADVRDLEDQLARVLSPGRAREVVRGLDGTYITALRITEHLGLPIETARRIWEIKADTLRALELLESSPTTSSQETLSRRRMLQERVSLEVRALVGDEGFAALRSADWTWWKGLEQPGALRANRRHP